MLAASPYGCIRRLKPRYMSMTALSPATYVDSARLRAVGVVGAVSLVMRLCINIASRVLCGFQFRHFE
jgi:hypothetical protein